MKKLFIIPLIVALASCSDLFGGLMAGAGESSDPTDARIKNILEDTCWGTAGISMPKGYQEMRNFHVVLVEGEDYDESAVTDVIFDGNSITFVFPSGGWRTTTYTYDKTSGLMKFDKPLLYGSTNFGGEDVYECRFCKDNILGTDYVGFYDASAEHWQKIDINKGQWRLNLAPMNNRQNEKLYEIDCIYGTSYTANDLGIEGGASWAYENVDGDKLFPATALDLGKVYYGLDYTMPDAAQAMKLVENCHSITRKSNSGADYVIIGNENSSLRFPKPANPGDEMGFWLEGGGAFVYSYGDEQTTDGDFKCTMAVLSEEEADGKMFCVRPVLK